MRSWIALVALVMGLGGCPASPEGSADLAMAPARCVPGETRVCTCLGGGEGVQTCQADGRRYTTCDGCPGGDGASEPPPLLPDGAVPSGSACGECAGCCNDAVCVTPSDQSATACGPKGDTCHPCGTGEICVQGTCVVDSGTCSPASCASGCCSQNVCIAPDKQSWALCGTGGDACSSCAYGVTCSGACTDDIDPNAAAFFIRVTYVGVATESWDYLSGPDLLVCFGSGAKLGCARPCGDNQYGCAVSGANGRITDAMGTPVPFTGAALRAGIPIAVWDEDSPDANDLIGSGSLPITKLRSSYSTGPFVSVDQLSFVLE